MKKQQIKLTDKEYSLLLDDYKDKVIDSFHKLNNCVAATAIEWNCEECLMKKKLIKWGIVEWYKEERHLISKEKILQIYNETKCMRTTHKRLGISWTLLNKKFKKFNIQKIYNNISDNYLKIINDENKLNGFFSYCKNHEKKEVAKEFNISVYYVNRILKEKGNENE